MFRHGLELCTGGPEEHSVLMDGSVTAKKKNNDFICLTNGKQTHPHPVKLGPVQRTFPHIYPQLKWKNHQHSKPMKTVVGI